MSIVKWVLALAVGGFLLVFGATKFTGGAHIFPYIEYKATALGFPMADLFFPLVNWATGLLEIVAGVLVIIPATRRLGALVAVAPFLGAVGFHLSPLLGVTTPDGYADPAPTEALAAGGPFLRDAFSEGMSPALFTIAAVMLGVSIVNLLVQRR
ncbi:MAG: hypothetical protein AAGJ87_05555 [Pseudomonadota bacterium]